MYLRKSAIQAMCCSMDTGMLLRTWLLPRQQRLEDALAKRHLSEGSLVLYDLSSTYFEGRKCPLARYGKSRDERPGNLQIVFGLLTNAEGCPVAVEVFEHGGARFEADVGHRSLLVQGNEIVCIEFHPPRESPWTGTTTYENAALGYSLEVRSTEIAP